MDVPETDSEDEIPPGWEQRCTVDGIVFYASHETKSTQWTHPRTGKKKKVTGELPFGWERQIESDGRVVFVDHANLKTTFTDPRLAFAVEETSDANDLRQRFDAGTSGLQVTHGMDLTGRKAIVTGANSGIGFETARSLALRGCTVILGVRDWSSGEDAVERLKREDGRCCCASAFLDLTSLQAVKEFAQTYKKKFGDCDILILNAGVFGLPFSMTSDSIETTFQVNFLSHFYLALLIQPLMAKSNMARIVFVAAEAHRFSSLSSPKTLKNELLVTQSNYLPTIAYNNSKLCCILGCFEIHRRFGDSGVKCFAVHPGNMVRTNLGRHWWGYRCLFAVVKPFTKSVQEACASSVYCAVCSELDNCAGMYVNNCAPCLPSSLALSPVLANAIWTFSLDLIEERMGKKAFFL